MTPRSNRNPEEQSVGYTPPASPEARWPRGIVLNLGFCQCGCGERTRLAPQTNKKLGWVKGQPIKFIVGHWAKLKWKGQAPHNWNGGVSQVGKKGRERGYLDILMPKHHRAHGHGYVFLHTLIAESALGKPLPREVVIHHHTIKQLVICQDQAYHSLLHKRTRALRSCGHADWWKCVECKEYDSLDNLVKHSRGSFIHPECRKERLKRYRLINNDKRRSYAQQNRERINENQRKRRAK
jgi:hypothetical protein